MMRAVSHPNVLDVEEVYEGDNNIYCLGKLYSGENLSKIISDKRVPISEEIVFTVAHKLINVVCISPRLWLTWRKEASSTEISSPRMWCLQTTRDFRIQSSLIWALQLMKKTSETCSADAAPPAMSHRRY